MKTHFTMLAAVTVFVAAGLAVTASAADTPTRRPNILLVLSDDHSMPHLGCYGNHDIKTPNLDRFAAEGMRFDRAYVACPQCVPSRAAFMTGRSPAHCAASKAEPSYQQITNSEQRGVGCRLSMAGGNGWREGIEEGGTLL